MKSLFQLESNRAKAEARFRAKERKLEEQRDALEAERRAMKYPHLLDYLKKLGNQCLPLIKGAVGFDLYGPFGLNNECSIYFHSKGTNKTRKTLASATFTRYGDGYGLKDYSKNTGRYSKGSIAEMNGGNFDTIEITEKMTIEWFVRFAKKSK